MRRKDDPFHGNSLQRFPGLKLLFHPLSIFAETGLEFGSFLGHLCLHKGISKSPKTVSLTSSWCTLGLWRTCQWLSSLARLRPPLPTHLLLLPHPHGDHQHVRTLRLVLPTRCKINMNLILQCNQRQLSRSPCWVLWCTSSGDFSSPSARPPSSSLPLKLLSHALKRFWWGVFCFHFHNI